MILLIPAYKIAQSNQVIKRQTISVTPFQGSWESTSKESTSRLGKP